MKKTGFGLLLGLCLVGGTYSFAMNENTPPLFSTTMSLAPYHYTISFIAPITTENVITTDTTYTIGKILAEYVYPRADGFASFAVGSCTDYVARQRPELFLNENGNRRLTGNAEDRLRNAKSLGMETGTLPKKGSIAVYYNGRGGRAYGHVAYVEDVQSNGVIIVSEMNYTEDYVVTLRAVDANLAAGYIY